MAHASITSKELLWHHDGMDMYLALLSVSGHEVNALEAMVSLAGFDAHRAVAVLCKWESVDKFRSGFGRLKGNVLGNALVPLLRMLKLLPAFGRKLCGIRFEQLLLSHLQNTSTVLRLNVLKAICALQESDREADVIGRTRSTVKALCRDDPAVLVQEMVKKFWR